LSGWRATSPSSGVTSSPPASTPDCDDAPPLAGWRVTPPGFVVTPKPPGPRYAITPAALIPTATYPSPLRRTPGPVTEPPIVHPAPRRPILLPGVGGPFQAPTPLARGTDCYKQHTSRASTTIFNAPQFDQVDYMISLEAIFRKDSQFIAAMELKSQQPQAGANWTNDSSGLMPNLSSLVANSEGAKSLCDLSDKLSALSLHSTQPQDDLVETYVTQLRTRFGCCITYDLIKRSVNLELLTAPLLCFDPREGASYRKCMRLWLTTATGPTIFYLLHLAFDSASDGYSNGKQCTIPHFWFVLLVRELLISSCFEKESGTLVRLSGCDMDPCHPSFRFFSLEAAIRELLTKLNRGHRIPREEPLRQKQVRGTCARNSHLAIYRTSARCIFCCSP
jgi:hypothetical protein